MPRKTASQESEGLCPRTGAVPKAPPSSESKLGLSDTDLQALDPYRNIFVQHKDQFAQHFYDVFQEDP